MKATVQRISTSNSATYGCNKQNKYMQTNISGGLQFLQNSWERGLGGGVHSLICVFVLHAIYLFYLFTPLWPTAHVRSQEYPSCRLRLQVSAAVSSPPEAVGRQSPSPPRIWSCFLLHSKLCSVHYCQSWIVYKTSRKIQKTYMYEHLFSALCTTVHNNEALWILYLV